MSEQPALGELNTVAELDPALDRLEEAWSDKPPQANSRYPVSDSLMVSVIALATHTHALTRAARVLLSDGSLVRQAAPIVRSALENALTAQWLYQYGAEALDAFLNENTRQGTNLVRSIQTEGWFAAGEAPTLSNPVPSLVDDAGRSFQRRCSDLTSGPAYTIYRVLSSLSHPGGATVTHYARFSEPPAIVLRPPPAEEEKVLMRWTCAVACVWAGRVTDLNDRNHPKRQFYRSLARELGTNDLMQKTEGGWLRSNTRGTRSRP